MNKHKPETTSEEIRRQPPTILALSSRLIMVYGHRRATAFFPIPSAPPRRIDKTRRL